MNRRIVEASLIAPPAGIVALTVAIAYVVPRNPQVSWYETWFGASGGNFFLIMFFGTPIAYVVEAVVGVPVYHWLVRTGRLRARWVVASATLAGALVVGSSEVATDGFSRILDLSVALLIGACAGVVAGATFWLLAFRGGRSAR